MDIYRDYEARLLNLGWGNSTVTQYMDFCSELQVSIANLTEADCISGVSGGDLDFWRKSLSELLEEANNDMKRLPITGKITDDGVKHVPKLTKLVASGNSGIYRETSGIIAIKKALAIKIAEKNALILEIAELEVQLAEKIDDLESKIKSQNL